MNAIEAKVSIFVKHIKRYLRKHHADLDKIKSIYSEWFSKSFEIRIDMEDTKNSSPSKIGRPKLGYTEAGSRLRRKMALEVAIANDLSTPLLLHAASTSARKRKNNEAVGVQQEVNIEKKIKNVSNKEPLKMSNNVALAYILENGLTKQQYINTKKLNKAYGNDIYPGYDAIKQTKMQCRPTGVQITESVAKVSLQDLLSHTAERILILQKEVLEQMENVTECTLIACYGFDGSTGQSSYKQKFDFDEPDSSDSSLFVATMIPIRLVDSLNRLIWVNKSPQSVRFCRPIKIEYAKESIAKIQEEKHNLDMQVANLQNFKSHSANISVNFKTYMTLIDGKVLNVLTNTKSTQCCPICAINPKALMHINDFSSKIFKPKPDSLKYGVSPLHAWIRFMEFVLNISYRIDIKTWHVKGENKNKMISRKKEIEQRIWKEMGLHISIPKQNGSGNSNDGNTARRIFANTKLFAEITLFDEVLLNKFHHLLIAISCEFAINTDKFRSFCNDTFLLYMQAYPWYPMSPTVHKIIVHGSDIMDQFVVPVGCLGENASEARNKLYKMDRRSHARKNCRLNNITDVFYRSIDSSDPLISSLNIHNTPKLLKKKSLPAEVIAFLETPTLNISSCYISEENNNENFNFNNNNNMDSETDDEEDYDNINEYSFVLDEEDF